MKNSLKTAIACMLFFTAMTAAILASANSIFTIDNQSTFDLGTVTLINNAGVRTNIDVNGSGRYSTDVTGGINQAIINNQSVNKAGQCTNVVLASGFVVQVTMNGNAIVVTDQNIVSGDKKPHGK